METKYCHGCESDIDVKDFYKNKARPDGLGTACKKCHKKENKKYRDKHPDRVYQKELDAKTALKIEVFSRYGEGTIRCAGKKPSGEPCDFSDLRALTIDHVHGKGNEHRRSIGRSAGPDFYRWLRENDYPEGFQVLCMNCQWIKRHENKEHNHHAH